MKDPSIIQANILHQGSGGDIASNDSHTAIAFKTGKKIELLSAYYTQCGCFDGLRDLIIRIVPSSTIKDLEDAEDGFVEISVLERGGREHNKPINFEDTTLLKTFFKNKELVTLPAMIATR